MELRAMAAPANIGSIRKFLTGYNIPIETGIRSKLYRKAQMKLILILLNVALLILIEFITSVSESFISTIPAALTVISDPELMATPTSA